MVVGMLNKKDQKTRKRKPNMYQPVVGYSHTMQIERDKEAWQAISDSLPDNAFADDVVPDDDDTKGKVSRQASHIETGLDNYG